MEYGETFTHTAYSHSPLACENIAISHSGPLTTVCMSCKRCNPPGLSNGYRNGHCSYSPGICSPDSAIQTLPVSDTCRQTSPARHGTAVALLWWTLFLALILPNRLVRRIKSLVGTVQFSPSMRSVSKIIQYARIIVALWQDPSLYKGFDHEDKVCITHAYGGGRNIWLHSLWLQQLIFVLQAKGIKEGGRGHKRVYPVDVAITLYCLQ